jgi:hypothetical protein
MGEAKSIALTSCNAVSYRVQHLVLRPQPFRIILPLTLKVSRTHTRWLTYLSSSRAYASNEKLCATASPAWTGILSDLNTLYQYKTGTLPYNPPEDLCEVPSGVAIIRRVDRWHYFRHERVSRYGNGDWTHVIFWQDNQVDSERYWLVVECPRCAKT